MRFSQVCSRYFHSSKMQKWPGILNLVEHFLCSSLCIWHIIIGLKRNDDQVSSYQNFFSFRGVIRKSSTTKIDKNIIIWIFFAEKFDFHHSTTKSLSDHSIGKWLPCNWLKICIFVEFLWYYLYWWRNCFTALRYYFY